MVLQVIRNVFCNEAFVIEYLLMTLQSKLLASGGHERGLTCHSLSQCFDLEYDQLISTQ